MIAHGWLMSAWHPSSAAQWAREKRVDEIQARLSAIGLELQQSWLPALALTGFITERDALWLELAGYGEWPWNVRRDGAQRYIRKAR